MLFPSNIFVFLFLPLTLIGYYILPKPVRNFFLLVMSLGFYAWGEPIFVFVMVASIILNYICGIGIAAYKGRERDNTAKAFLITSIVINLLILGFFKYANFVLDNLRIIPVLSSLPPVFLDFHLPIGISFYTFQNMSYTIDLYRGDAKVQKNITSFGMYVALFPQLVAGPIIRYKDIASQIKDRITTFGLFSEGVRRFIIGFSKKMLLANNMALIADRAFAMGDAERSAIYAWLGVIAYAFQIFFDFSGYSDMAIGLGRMYGFKFLENFDYPYISASVSEFWRRWHISLGRWFRDYVYFPLGGSRVNSITRLMFNLFVVWLLTGIWHGAAWNFILWGLMYFVLIAFEKNSGYPNKFKLKSAKVAYRVFTLLCVLGGWVLFRAQDISAALRYGASMFTLQDNPVFCDSVILTFREYWVFLIFSVLCSTMLFKKLSQRVQSSENKVLRITLNTAKVCVYIFFFIWSVSFIILGEHNPFIYFNF
jgi:D-alanyl-lipoteichoic acid acyltransferase DltB (MBOAT superfamily)